MTSIHPLLPHGAVFDPAVLVSMGEAFDKACTLFHCENEPHILRQVIAAQIIITAERGECDPDRLLAATTTKIGVTR